MFEDFVTLFLPSGLISKLKLRCLYRMNIGLGESLATALDFDDAFKRLFSLTTGYIKLPPNWSAMGSKERLRLVDLTSDSPEYQDVAKNFWSTSEGTVRQVVKVRPVSTLRPVLDVGANTSGLRHDDFLMPFRNGLVWWWSKTIQHRFTPPPPPPRFTPPLYHYY